MSVREYCHEKVETASPTESLREAALRLDRSGVGCLVVVAADRVSGVLTDRDVALAVFDAGMDPDRTQVQALLVTEPVVVAADRPLRVAAALMRQHHLRRLPVVDAEGRLVGIVARDDLIQLLARELGAVSGALSVQQPCGSAVRTLDDLVGAPV